MFSLDALNAANDRWWIDRDPATPWWQYPCDYYYYKNDWKAQLITVPRDSSHMVKLDSPAASGWCLYFLPKNQPRCALSVAGSQVGAAPAVGFLVNLDLGRVVKGKREFTISAGGATQFIIEGEITCENGSIAPLRTDQAWGGKATVGDIAKAGAARAYITPPIMGTLWAPTPEERGKRDIAKALGRIQKWRQKIEYDLRAARTPEEIVMLEEDGLYARVMAKTRPLVQTAEKHLRNAGFNAQANNDFPAAIAAARHAGDLLSQAEAMGETLLELRMSERQVAHIEAIIALAAGVQALPPVPKRLVSAIGKTAETLAGLDAELRDAMDKPAERFIEFDESRGEMLEDLAALRKKVAAFQRMKDFDTGHQSVWAEALCEELRGYLERAEWEMELGSLSGARRMLRAAADWLNDAVEKNAARTGRVEKRIIPTAGSGQNSLPARSAWLLQQTRQLTAELAAALKTPVGAPDSFPSDRFGWIPSMRLLGGETCRYGNDPQHFEFNYTPETAPLISLAGRWRFARDPLDEGIANGWQNPEHSSAGWEQIYAPDWWERQGIDGPLNFNLVPESTVAAWKQEGRKSVNRGFAIPREDKPYNGFAWYRTEVFIPGDWRGRDIVFRTGAVANQIQLFVNGRAVSEAMEKGSLGIEDRTIPASLWRFGATNVIAARLFNAYNFGGLAEPPLELFPAGYDYFRRLTTRGNGFVYDEEYPAGQSEAPAGGAAGLSAGNAAIRVYASSLSPGMVMAASGDVIRLWGWRQKGFAPPVELSFESGNGQAPHVVALGDKDASVPGAQLAANWLWLRSDDARQRDLLLVLTERPEAIAWRGQTAGGELRISFEHAPCRVLLIRPFFGGPATDEKLAQCKEWSRRLMAYPVGASELAVDAGRENLMDYRLSYRYLEFPPGGGKDFAVESPDRIAPLPMLCSYALKHDFPGLVCASPAAPTGYESRYAPYRACAGSEIAYSGPRLPFAPTRKGTTDWFDYRQYASPQMNAHHKYLGMDHYRFTIPFCAPYHLQLMSKLYGPPLDNEEKWLELDRIINRAVEAGITAILYYAPFHTTDTYWADDDYINRDGAHWLTKHPDTSQFAEFWARVAKRYAHLPPEAIAYNFWGEPAYMTYPFYNPLMKQVTAAVRAVDKTHKIYVDFADGWAQPFWCEQQEVTGDANTHYCFHHYGEYMGHDYETYYNADAYPEYPPFYSNDNAMHLDIVLDAILFSFKHNVTLNWTETGVSIIQPLYGDRDWLNDWFAMMARWGIGYSWYNYAEGIWRTGLTDNGDATLTPLAPLLRKWNAW